MSKQALRLHAMAAGSMTSPLGGFLDGERGEITYPVPVFVIEHSDGLVVIDAGLHPDFATSEERLGSLRGIFHTRLAADGSLGPMLETNGFDPAQVDLLILTHLHFDHTGGIGQLPNARIIVQQREWAEIGLEHTAGGASYNSEDLNLGHDRQEIDGDHDVFGDGSVTCLLTDGHTAGHQSVRVNTGEHSYVICGDCCYLRRTLTDEHLPPGGHDLDRQLASVRRMAAEQADGATLLFGHDPEQWTRITADGLRPQI